MRTHAHMRTRDSRLAWTVVGWWRAPMRASPDRAPLPHDIAPDPTSCKRRYLCTRTCLRHSVSMESSRCAIKPERPKRSFGDIAATP